MNSLRELYQEVIMDHNRNPRNHGVLCDASHKGKGFNPLCGDELELYLYVNKESIIEEIRFQGKGCAISTASASIMTETLRGRSVNEAEKYFHEFRALMTGEAREVDQNFDLGKLEVLNGVSEYPARVKCATLAWHTLLAALEGDTNPARTEY
jgi:nitrogen fixation NifU-like protein